MSNEDSASEQSSVQAAGDVNLSPHPLVNSLYPNPAEPAPDLVALVGYLGPSTRAGNVRLYQDLTFHNYYEIPQADIMATSQLVQDDPNSPTLLRVRASAPLELVSISSQSVQASFLKGAISSGYLGGAVGTGAGVATLVNCPGGAAATPLSQASCWQTCTVPCGAVGAANPSQAGCWSLVNCLGAGAAAVSQASCWRTCTVDCAVGAAAGAPGAGAGMWSIGCYTAFGCPPTPGVAGGLVSQASCWYTCTLPCGAAGAATPISQATCWRSCGCPGGEAQAPMTMPPSCQTCVQTCMCPAAGAGAMPPLSHASCWLTCTVACAAGGAPGAAVAAWNTLTPFCQTMNTCHCQAAPGNAGVTWVTVTCYCQTLVTCHCQAAPAGAAPGTLIYCPAGGAQGGGGGLPPTLWITCFPTHVTACGPG